MDVISLGFLLIMILAGGLVALIADKLGRTLGKKRLTLFGLRPRHTATMITVLAGMLIPFITVLFVALVSKDVRDWIVEGRQAIGKAKEAQAQVDQLTVQKRDLTNVTIGLKNQNDQELKKQREIEEKLAVEQSKLAVENQRVAALQGKLTTLQNQQTKLTANLQRVNLALSVATRDTKAAVIQRETAQAGLAKAVSQLNQVKESFNELKKQQDELYAQNNKLLSENEKLTSSNSTLTSENQKVQTDLDASRVNLERSQEQLDDVNVRLTQMNKQVGVLTNAFNSDVNISRFQPIIFDIGDELARASIPAHTTAEDAKGLYANLMHEANRYAEVHGAGHLSDSSPDFAGLFARKDVNGNILDPQAQEQTILKGITGMSDDIVLVALASANTFSGEWVPMDIKPYKNPLVYKRNDTVAETRINGSMPEEAIRQAIVDFLTHDVKPKAVAAHMVPVAGQAEQFGEVPINDIVDLARTIHEAQRPVKVAALSNFDTRAADALHLHFRVR